MEPDLLSSTYRESVLIPLDKVHVLSSPLEELELGFETKEKGLPSPIEMVRDAQWSGDQTTKDLQGHVHPVLCRTLSDPSWAHNS